MSCLLRSAVFAFLSITSQIVWYNLCNSTMLVDRSVSMGDPVSFRLLLSATVVLLFLRAALCEVDNRVSSTLPPFVARYEYRGSTSPFSFFLNLESRVSVEILNVTSESDVFANGRCVIINTNGSLLVSAECRLKTRSQRRSNPDDKFSINTSVTHRLSDGSIKIWSKSELYSDDFIYVLPPVSATVFNYEIKGDAVKVRFAFNGTQSSLSRRRNVITIACSPQKSQCKSISVSNRTIKVPGSKDDAVIDGLVPACTYVCSIAQQRNASMYYSDWLTFNFTTYDCGVGKLRNSVHSVNFTDPDHSQTQMRIHLQRLCHTDDIEVCLRPVGVEVASQCNQTISDPISDVSFTLPMKNVSYEVFFTTKVPSVNQSSGEVVSVLRVAPNAIELPLTYIGNHSAVLEIPNDYTCSDCTMEVALRFCSGSQDAIDDCEEQEVLSVRKLGTKQVSIALTDGSMFLDNFLRLQPAEDLQVDDDSSFIFAQVSARQSGAVVATAYKFIDCVYYADASALEADPTANVDANKVTVSFRMANCERKKRVRRADSFTLVAVESSCSASCDQRLPSCALTATSWSSGYNSTYQLSIGNLNSGSMYKLLLCSDLSGGSWSEADSEGMGRSRRQEWSGTVNTSVPGPVQYYMEFGIFVLVPLMISIFLVLGVYRFRRRKRQEEKTARSVSAATEAQSQRLYSAGGTDDAYRLTGTVFERDLLLNYT